ncbi:universal stress protein [Halobaculum sp. CBA1158]|uniref:universal stress protein n=1 Tax=Halobaculum sp. CBA1158 TaxID=2904243 RepID=UPI001F1B3A15|nr:universal stress protein [Halobaculum sp. CBA1158]UIP00971.1 universal stress protein [Halobaculum sp. CBA1158]
MTRLLERVVVPVASEADAIETARALTPHEAELGDVTLTYVVEKAGGAPDKAGVEQREEAAREAFDAFAEVLPAVTADHRIAYDTDIVDGILGVVDETDATAIAFTPREGGRFVRLLTGDISLRLVTGADVPVVSLPRRGGDDAGDEDGESGAVDGDEDE